MYKNDILVDSFYNISNAATKTNRSRSAISKYISGKCIDRSGFIWKRFE